MSSRTLKIIEAFCIALFLFIMFFIFVLPDGMPDPVIPVFSIAYRTGARIIGAGLVVTCFWGDGKYRIIMGILLFLCYLITTYVTLFGLIVLTTGWELLWYIHPLIILPGCVIALLLSKKKSDAARR